MSEITWIWWHLKVPGIIQGDHFYSIMLHVARKVLNTCTTKYTSSLVCNCFLVFVGGGVASFFQISCTPNVFYSLVFIFAVHIFLYTFLFLLLIIAWSLFFKFYKKKIPSKFFRLTTPKDGCSLNRTIITLICCWTIITLICCWTIINTDLLLDYYNTDLLLDYY